jgi:hypothetical protein
MTGRRVLALAACLALVAAVAACDPEGPTPAGCESEVSPALDVAPTPANVGLPDGWTPTQVITGDLIITTPNTTLVDVEVTGSIDVMAENTQLCRVRVHHRIWNQFNPGSETNPGGPFGDEHQWSFRVYDSTIGTPGDPVAENVTKDGAIGPGRYTANRNEVYGSDGFRVSEPHQGGPQEVDVFNNYVRTQVTDCDAGLHTDGIQAFFGGVGVNVVHNTFDNRSCGNNGAVFFADCSSQARVVANLLMGGAFVLRIHDDHGNDARCPSSGDVGPWDIQHNRIVDGAWDFGPALTTNTECSNAATMTWADNRLVTIDAGYQITSTGAEVGC